MNPIALWAYRLNRWFQKLQTPVFLYRMNKALLPLEERRTKLKIIYGFSLIVFLYFSYGWLAYMTLIRFETPWSISLLGINFSGHYQQWDKKRKTPYVLDADGKFVGLFPRGLAIGFNNDTDSNGYRTAPISDVPETWWKMVVALEDANQGKWFHHDGIDFSIFPKKFIGARGGGSTITMQLVKSMNRDTDTGNNWIGHVRKMVRKVRDFLHAPALNYFLSHQSPDALSKWYANHIPLMLSASRGLIAASYTAFAVPPEQLSLAQQAVLAAAIKYNIRKRGISARMQMRARFALGKIYRSSLITKTQFQKAELELSSMPRQLGLIHGPLYNCLNSKQRNINNHIMKLESRASHIARSELIEANAELVDQFGIDWINKVSKIQLTTKSGQNCQFKKTIYAKATRLFDRIGHEPLIDLSVANEHGDIIAFFSNSYLPQYHGYNRHNHFSKYNPAGEQRKIGSIGKVIASIIAGMEGDELQTRYFMAPRHKIIGYPPNEIIVPFRNSDGFEGSMDRQNPRSRGWIPAIDAFGQSNNLAVMDRMQHSRSLGKIPKLIHDFGLTKNNNPDQRPNYVIDLPMGNIYASGRAIHTMMRAISLHLKQATVNGHCMPSILKKVILSRRSNEVAVKKHRSSVCKQTAKYFKDEHTRFFVQHVLSAVVDREHKGTASQALGPWAGKGNNNISWHIAKTGTTSKEARISEHKIPGTYRAMITGAFNSHGQIFCYYVQILPGQGHTNLGNHFYGGHAAFLLRPILHALVADISLHKNSLFSSKGKGH